MHRVNNHPFYASQKLCDEALANAKFFMKLKNTSFSGFDTIDDFIAWFKEYKKICDKENKSIQFYEVIRTHLANAFYADIEVYSETILTPPEIIEIQNVIIESVEKNMKIRVPMIERRGAWTGDHRPVTKKGNYKFKVSLHVVFNDLLFDNVSRKGPMFFLADDVNKLVTKDLRDNGGALVNSLHIPDDTVLDMAVYRGNGCMRGVFGSKSENANEFFRPIGQFTNIRDYLITQECSIEDIPEEKLVKMDPGAANSLTKRTIPRKSACSNSKAVNPEDQTETQRIITEQLKTWGDTTSSVTPSDPDHNGCPRYYVGGPARVCPPCNGKVHDGNRASVTDLGSGNFAYRCLHPTAPSKPHPFYVPSESPNKKKKARVTKSYLGTLVGITARGIVVKAPMGTGKTFRTMEFIKSMGPDVSVLWVTPRRAMAMKLKGDYPEFALYTEEMNKRLQIVEYESLYKLTRGYDIIILDEIRSLAKTFVCTKTNRLHLEEHMKLMVGLCTCSKHVLMLDADIDIDGAVRTFTDHVFGAEPIHEVVHDSGSMGLDVVYVNSGEILTRMMNDLKQGNRIMLCCGSSERLKGIAQTASELVGSDRVGAYFADSETQPEIMDVNLHWGKYLFVGFTSTITCSISYEGEVRRVYVIPSTRTASPREMAQMVARARNITSNQVIIETDTSDLYPLNPDLNALYEENLADLIRKRQFMIKSSHDAERMYVSTIERNPTRNGMVFAPHILTKLGAWNMVEEYLKEFFWHNEFIRVITGKRFTWRMDEYVSLRDGSDQEENMDNMLTVKRTKEVLQIMNVIKLDLADACDLPPGFVADVIYKKTRNLASEEELVLFRKNDVQRFFNEPLMGDQVIEFERNKKSILNLILMTRMDSLFRNKLYLNDQEMGHMPEFGKEDLHVFSLLKEALLCCGVRRFTDTSTSLDFESHSDMLKGVLDKIDRFSTTRSQGKGLNKRLQRYLESYVGMTLNPTRVWNKKLKKRVRGYNLMVLYPEWLELETVLGSDSWVRGKFKAYDRFKKVIIGTEYQENKAKRTIIDFCSKRWPSADNPFACFAYRG